MRLNVDLRSLAGRTEATAIKGVFEGSYVLFGQGVDLAETGLELNLNWDVAVGARTICDGLLDRQPNSTGGAGK